MRRPKGFSDTKMPAIVGLVGGLYGLDIASKLFEEHFSNTLATMGFKRLIFDPKVFRLDKDGDFYLLSTVVDDALAANSPGSPLLDFVETRHTKLPSRGILIPTSVSVTAVQIDLVTRLKLVLRFLSLPHLCLKRT